MVIEWGVQVFGPPQFQVVREAPTAYQAAVGTIAAARVEKLKDGIGLISNKLTEHIAAKRQ